MIGFAGQLTASLLHTRPSAKWLEEERLPGWYVRVSSKKGRKQGVFKEIQFPLKEDGGPVTSAAALRLLDPDDPAMFTMAQWRFLYAEWIYQTVEELVEVEEVEEEEIVFGEGADVSYEEVLDSAKEEAKQGSSTLKIQIPKEKKPPHSTGSLKSVPTGEQVTTGAGIEELVAGLVNEVSELKKQYREAREELAETRVLLQETEDRQAVFRRESMEEANRTFAGMRGDFRAVDDNFSRMRLRVQKLEGRRNRLRSIFETQIRSTCDEVFHRNCSQTV